MNISPETWRHVQVRIWQLPLTRPARWGPLNRPRRVRFPRRSPCQPSHLESERSDLNRTKKQIGSQLIFPMKRFHCYLSLKLCRWVSPAPEPACYPARSLGESGCTSGLSHIPGNRVEKGNTKILCSNSHKRVKAHLRIIVTGKTQQDNIQRQCWVCYIFNCSQIKTSDTHTM